MIRMHHPSTPTLRVCSRLLLLVAGLAISGCNVTMVPSTAILSREEFSRTVERQDTGPVVSGTAVADAAASPAEGTLAVTPAEMGVTGPIAASSGINDATAVTGGPGDGSGSLVTPLPVNASVFVDSKIGDINGRAIYAGEFLETMGDRLRAEAEKKNRADWTTFARTEISRELDALIEDELLTAEALASFTPEQKQGFFAFMQTVSRRLTAQNLGSRTLTEQRVQESEGKSLDKVLQDRRETELIKFQLQERIYKRVNVSWRDIKQTYERFYDEFNPPPKSRFRLIQISKSEPEAIAAVEQGLANGTSFETLALVPENLAFVSNKERKAVREVVQNRDPAKTTFFANKDLNAIAAAMSAGEVKGPIPTDPTVTWLRLEEVVQESMPLYDAQLRIETFLKNNRNDLERKRYVARLRERASITDVGEMTDRLVEIALDRFYPEEGAAPAASAP